MVLLDHGALENRAVALLLVAVASILLSCNGHSGVTIAASIAEASDASELEADAGPERIAALPNAQTPLVTPTYDGSGQAVEPTVLSFTNGWHGHHYWMATSPYPDGDSAFENPSILVSEDGLTWSVPEGLTNPLTVPTQGALADATLVHDDATDELWVYFLDELKGGGHQSLQRMTSSDGIHWSAPTEILAADHYSLGSPSIVEVEGVFTMWTVDVGEKGCTSESTAVTHRTSADGLHWSQPQPLPITQPGYVIWHLNVNYVRTTRQFVSVFAAYPLGRSCNWTELFLADSDGTDWETYSGPLLTQGRGWDSRTIYRSSLLYEPATSRLRVWYSARDRRTNAWHVGYTEGLAPL